MELRTLYYFLTVAREENITRAAKTIHIGQPALSRQLMQLEDEIGAPLFIRGKRKIQLTKAGMLLRRRAEEILNLVAKTEEELQLETTLSGELMLGLAECLASHQMLPKIIESFSQQHPEVTYNFYSGNADLIKERLDQGLIDVGIVLEPVDIQKYQYLRLPQKERWGIITSIHHPLADHETVSPQDLISMPLLHPHRSLVQHEIANWFGKLQGAPTYLGQYTFLSNALSLAKQQIASIISIEGAFYTHDKQELRFIPLAPELMTGTVMIWKKNSIQSQLVDTFIEAVKQTI